MSKIKGKYDIDYSKWDNIDADLQDSSDDEPKAGRAAVQSSSKDAKATEPSKDAKATEPAQSGAGKGTVSPTRPNPPLVAKPASSGPVSTGPVSTGPVSPGPAGSPGAGAEEEESESALAAKLEMQKKKYEKRKKVTYKGRTIYEWEQTLEEVDMYIKPPPGITSRMITCNIKPDRLQVGLKGKPFFLDELLGGRVDSDESFWMFGDGVLHINLQKASCGQTWTGATRHRGQQLSPLEQAEMKQKILLERFQREHPGFDFSQAKFNGAAPDARKFMGGINTTSLDRNTTF